MVVEDFLHEILAPKSFALRDFLERSEERRVGKECRSLCDWSSDVCSSDLVFETAASHQSWNAACIRTCHSDETSWAVAKTRCHLSGTSDRPRGDPWLSRIFCTRSSRQNPSRFATSSKDRKSVV